MSKYIRAPFFVLLIIIPLSHAGGLGKATIVRPTPASNGSCGSPLTGGYALMPSTSFYGSQTPHPLCQKCLLIKHDDENVKVPIKGLCQTCQDEDIQVAESTLNKLEPGAQSIPLVYWSIYPCPT